MAVSIERIKPGAVFRFKTAARRVVSVSERRGSGFMVDWEYADGQRRGGRIGGSQWVHYFRSDAIEEIPDPLSGGEFRRLKPSGRQVPCLKNEVDISLTTRCPAKWLMVDLETGELWQHDGVSFERAKSPEADRIARALSASPASAESTARLDGDK